jgi:membrane-bound ClpP family serine protease
MLTTLLSSTQTLVYLGIALASFVAVAGTFLFGGDHDHDHDVDHAGMGDHEIGVFSPKIIFSFTLGFGAAGSIASAYGLHSIWCLFSGAVFGLILGGGAYGILALFYKQQASSVIPTESALGKIASVTSEIPDAGLGEVGVDVRGQYQIYLARSRRGKTIPKGARVKIVENQGGELVVEPETGI